MKYSIQLLLFISIALLGLQKGKAQCNQTQTISICEMETIDFDNDGNPDGIINLYDETGLTPQSGDIWISTGNDEADIALNSVNGNVNLWKIEESASDYRFELRNSSCTSGIVITVNLILGPYPGKPVVNGFFPVCDVDDICEPGIEIDIDLFETLETREEEAPPHKNGVWTYTGSLPPDQYTLSAGSFGSTIPYTPEDDSPIDSEDFTFTYTVGAQGTCAEKSVDVKITLIRPPFAGYPNSKNICLSDIDSWDRTINLRDDEFLIQEDLNGRWTYNGAEITETFNLKTDYIDPFLASAPVGFTCKAFSFNYFVGSRAAICPDSRATITFRIYEEIREFQQQNPLEEICIDSNPYTELDLYSLLQFEAGYEYTNTLDEELVTWELESGPVNGGDLGLANFLASANILEKHKGTIDFSGIIPGTYEFRFTVNPSSNCLDNGSSVDYTSDLCMPSVFLGNPCNSQSTLVTIRIQDFDYAGEDTSLDLCISDYSGTISLRSLLQSNGNTIEEGVWTDTNTGLPFDNDFIVPETVSGSSSFLFTHTTTTMAGCDDSAILEFTFYEVPSSGEGGAITICSDNLTLNLFDQLSGNPSTTGTWTGPFGYESQDHIGRFDSSDTTLPILGPGTYTYLVPGNAGCPTTDQTTITISFVNPIDIGMDRSESFCEIDGRVNLFTLLDRDTPRTGTFEDIENTGALTPEGVVEFDLLPNPDNETNKIYNFKYSFPNTAPCEESSLNVAVQIIDLPEPIVPDQEFCILDAKRLEDIEVDVLNYNWYDTIESIEPIIDNPLLFDNQVFYIANVDSQGCESERVQVNVSILNMGERFSNGEICTLDFQDGVSPDGNNLNDTFDLFIEGVYNIPEAFPDFKLQIYNRYGTLVYEGNRDTEEFRGESNTSIRLGDDLPSGTYFYIFTPNFENNLPIQGSFYLSR